VDDGLIAPEGVGPLCQLAHPGNAPHIADHDMLGRRQRLTGVIATLSVARVQGDGVAVVDEQPRGHEAEPVARAGDQYPCHANDSALALCPMSKTYIVRGDTSQV
jgi:hypothetical protein